METEVVFSLSERKTSFLKPHEIIPRNYLLPDCSVLYTHTDGSVYLYVRTEGINVQISRNVAAYILNGARHHPREPVLRY